LRQGVDELKDADGAKERLVNEVLEVHPGLFVLQLNGNRGSQSMQQLKNLLSQRSEQKGVSVTLVDATGVANIDDGIVQHLTDIIKALRLLDTKILLARRDPSIDRNLARLGVNLSDITTCYSLAAGLWVALDIVESWTAGKTNKAKITKSHKVRQKINS
jgi:anti-anti-sigma regulatory factor